MACSPCPPRPVPRAPPSPGAAWFRVRRGDVEPGAAVLVLRRDRHVLLRLGRPEPPARLADRSRGVRSWRVLGYGPVRGDRGVRFLRSGKERDVGLGELCFAVRPGHLRPGAGFAVARLSPGRTRPGRDRPDAPVRRGRTSPASAVSASQAMSSPSSEPVLRSSVSGLPLPSSVAGRDGTRLKYRSGIALRTNSRVARKSPPFPVRCQYNAPDRPRVPARAPSRRGPVATCQVSPSRSCPRGRSGRIRAQRISRHYRPRRSSRVPQSSQESLLPQRDPPRAEFPAPARARLPTQSRHPVAVGSPGPSRTTDPTRPAPAARGLHLVVARGRTERPSTGGRGATSSRTGHPRLPGARGHSPRTLVPGRPGCLPRTQRSRSGQAPPRPFSEPKCQTPALSSNRHRIRLDIRTNLGSNRWSNAGRVR